MSAYQAYESNPGFQQINNRSGHFIFQQTTLNGPRSIPGQTTEVIRTFQEDAKVRNQDAGLCIVIEDIDHSLAHTLAGLLDIELSFFTNHFASDLFTDSKDDINLNLLSLLPSRVCCGDTANISYQRVVKVHRDGLLPGSVPYILHTADNSNRIVRSIQFGSEHSFGLTRACFSIVRKRLDNGCWICLMLVDSTTADLEFNTDDTCNARVQNFKVQQTPYRKFRVSRLELLSTHSAPQNHQNGTRYTPTTMLDEVSSTVKNVPTEFWRSDSSLVQLAQGAISIIIDEWMIYTLLMGRCVKLHEPSLLVMSERLIDGKLDKTITELFRWRRRSQQSLIKLQALRYLLEDPPNLYGKSDTLIKDLDFITRRLEQFRDLLEAMVPMWTTTIELADSARAMHEAVYVKNLTYIALIFLPLNFVSSLLSMSDEFAVNSTKFWVYWLAAVPLLIAVLTVSHFAPLEIKGQRLSLLFGSR